MKEYKARVVEMKALKEKMGREAEAIGSDASRL